MGFKIPMNLFHWLNTWEEEGLILQGVGSDFSMVSLVSITRISLVKELQNRCSRHAAPIVCYHQYLAIYEHTSATLISLTSSRYLGLFVWASSHLSWLWFSFEILDEKIVTFRLIKINGPRSSTVNLLLLDLSVGVVEYTHHVVQSRTSSTFSKSL